MGKRFHYSLEPVALQRQWKFDALQRELGDCNRLLAQHVAEHDAVLREVATGALTWKALGEDGLPVPVERFVLLTRFLGERRDQAAAMAVRVAACTEQRDALVARLAAAQRAIDAIQRHRNDMHQHFKDARASVEFRHADDQWAGRQSMGANDGD